MKILKAETVTSIIVKTDESEWPYYRRSGKGNWENLMGESWEAVYFGEEELEKAFIDFNS